MHILMVEKEKFQEIKELISKEVEHTGTVGLVPTEVVITFKSEEDREAAKQLISEITREN